MASLVTVTTVGSSERREKVWRELERCRVNTRLTQRNDDDAACPSRSGFTRCVSLVYVCHRDDVECREAVISSLLIGGHVASNTSARRMFATHSYDDDAETRIFRWRDVYESDDVYKSVTPAIVSSTLVAGLSGSSKYIATLDELQRVSQSTSSGSSSRRRHSRIFCVFVKRAKNLANWYLTDKCMCIFSIEGRTFTPGQALPDTMTCPGICPSPGYACLLRLTRLK